MNADARLARLSEGHYGVFHRCQAHDEGVSDWQLRHRVACEMLEELLPGIYRITSVARSWRQMLKAVELWAGPEAAVCGRSAAALIGLDGFDEGFVEVLTTRKLRAPSPEIKVFVTKQLPASHRRLKQSIWITTIERTLLDLGRTCSVDRVEDAIDSALHRRLTTVSRLNHFFERIATPGMNGCATFRKALAAFDIDHVPSESQFERRLFRLLRRSKLPVPDKQHWVQVGRKRFRLDFAYPDVKVAIEAQSSEHHGRLKDRDRDYSRHNLLVAAGWRIIYVSWRRMCHEPVSVVREVRALFARETRSHHA